jgi:hypothetical protein
VVVAVIFYIARYHGLFGFKPAGLGVPVYYSRIQVSILSECMVEIKALIIPELFDIGEFKS